MTNQIASNLRNILQRIQEASLKQTTNVSFCIVFNLTFNHLNQNFSILALV